MRQGRDRPGAGSVALRCLTSPLAVSGLALLILNDHWLKQWMPGLLTGKLSDVGGLAFFPFLLAAGLAVVVRRPRVVGCAAFWTAGAVFSIVKVVPAAAAGASRALSAVVTPSLIRPDPTDLIALVVLYPAWLLWRRYESGGAAPPRRRTVPAYAVVPVAVLATLATSCGEPDSVYALIASGGVLRADLGSATARSEDGGRTWTREEYDADNRIVAEVRDGSPEVLCEPGGQTCYRVSGEPVVEVSTDGGVSWAIAWQIPPDRRKFVRRHEERGAVCGGAAEINAVDGELVDVGGTSVFVAALGDEGVVVGTADGDWQQFAVGGAEPEPLTGAFSVVGAEAGWSGLAALLMLWSGLGAAEVRRRRHMPAVPRQGMWIAVGVVLTLAVAAAVGALLVAASFIVGPLLFFGHPGSISPAVLVCVVAAGTVVTARLVRTHAAMADRSAPYRALAAAALSWVVMVAPFVVWSAGPMTYQAALAAAVVVGLVATPFVVRVAMDRSFERVTEGGEPPPPG